jgi:hypothetical protein
MSNADRPINRTTIADGSDPNPAPKCPELEKATHIVRLVATVLILLAALLVALSPGVVYAPVPKVILFTLVAILPGVLFGAEVLARTNFTLNLGVASLSAVGVGALFFGLFYMMTQFAKPEQQLAVFYVVDKQGQPVNLDLGGAVRPRLSATGLPVKLFVDGNALVINFPEQVPEVTLDIQEIANGPVVSKTVGYAGNRERTIVLD